MSKTKNKAKVFKKKVHYNFLYLYNYMSSPIMANYVSALVFVIYSVAT